MSTSAMRPQPAATRHARRSMVCSVDHLASAAGSEMLVRGGSAADAAVATSAVLAVTTQHMCGMGGDLWALVHDGGQAPVALDASGRAGAGSDPAALRAEGHTSMPLQGDVRSVTVPGCVDGWLALHERYGRLPLAEVLAPAIDAAEWGFPAAPLLVAAAPRVAGLPGADDFAAADRPGRLVRRPGLATALRAVVAQGRDGWYGGAFGEGLLRLGAGLFAPADLARPLADWVTPLHVEAWGHRLWTVPPPSQGYLTLAAAWIASGLDLPATDDDAWAHLLVESARQAGHDRLAVLHEDADGADLLAPARLAPRRDAIDPGRAATLGAPAAGGGTIYLCAVDEDRLGVSLIQSNAMGFGAGIFVPGVGVSLHNRGIGFSLDAGHPAELAPGRRPPSTLSPALVTTTDGALRTVVGTMGGDAQPQIVLQVLARLLGHGATPGKAVTAPRWQLAPETGSGFDTWTDPHRLEVAVEPHAPAAWEPGLRARGHRVRVAHGNYGHAHLIDLVDAGGVLAGATDPRAGTGGVAAR